VWSRSKYVEYVDIAFNDTCRTIMGCLRPTLINKIYCLSGIAPLENRNETTDLERANWLKDERYSIFKYKAKRTRLKSRQSFIHSAIELKDPPNQTRLQRWKNEAKLNNLIQSTQYLTTGKDLQWNLWETIID